jgi:small ligand-binding sensory domain FIST
MTKSPYVPPCRGIAPPAQGATDRPKLIRAPCRGFSRVGADCPSLQAAYSFTAAQVLRASHKRTLSTENTPFVRCARAFTASVDLRQALRECCDTLEAALDGRRPHLVTVFFTSHHTSHAEALREGLVERLGPEVLLGCPASGVIAGSDEAEKAPGLVVWAAYWPGVKLRPFTLRPVHDGKQPSLCGWPEPSEISSDAGFLVLSDPFSAPSEVLLDQFGQRFPNHVMVGGLASATSQNNEGCLLSTYNLCTEGLVGVAISGSIQLDAVVSQGCRPVGHHFVITAASRHMIHELGGQPALTQLQATMAQADKAAQELMQQGALHIGRVVDECKSSFSTGDLVVRNVLGFDPKLKSIAISDHVRPGQTVQFMVRDPSAAHDDLTAMLVAESEQDPPLGALMFSCNGRGSDFFGRERHDIDRLHTALGPVPTAGFFAAGELGPVGGEAFLHGLTASIALFRARG